MTRAEHMQWCKDRAIKEIEYSGRPHSGLISIISDLGKHPETSNHTGIMLTVMLMATGQLADRHSAIEHIKGFN